MLKKFSYTNKKGETKDRVVYVTCAASDSHLGLDLSEYDEDMRAVLIENLQEAHKEYMQAIEDLGLKKNWRRFLVDSIDGQVINEPN